MCLKHSTLAHQPRGAEVRDAGSPKKVRETKTKMKTSTQIKHSAAVQATVSSSCRTRRFLASAVAGIALTFAFTNAASAQSLPWDDTRAGNPYVAAG